MRYSSGYSIPVTFSAFIIYYSLVSIRQVHWKKLSVDSALLLECFYHTGPSNSVSVKLSWESSIHYVARSTKFTQKRVQKPSNLWRVTCTNSYTIIVSWFIAWFPFFSIRWYTYKIGIVCNREVICYMNGTITAKKMFLRLSI